MGIRCYKLKWRDESRRMRDVADKYLSTLVKKRKHDNGIYVDNWN